MDGRARGIPAPGDRRGGMSLVEIALAISILGLILIGVLGSLSMGFMAKKNNSDQLANQFFARRIIEQMQSTPYVTLLSFNGTSVTSTDGKYRSSIAVRDAGLNLLRIVVISNALTNPEISYRLVTMVAKLD
jgi:type II secretory pathway pseudopilin PulG